MITVWWEGIPGLDYRYPPPGADTEFADRMAALACAMRVTGADPSGKLPRPLANLADDFLDHFQVAETPLDGYIRRLTVAMVCAAWKNNAQASAIIDRAKTYQKYLMRAVGERGGWM